MKGNIAIKIVLIGFLGVGLTVLGCLNRDLAPSDPHTQSGVHVDINQTGITKVDILFVVDNSNSMQEEQTILSKQIVAMARELINPADRGPDTPPAVADLHIGIVSTDMGTAGQQVMTCENAMSGDNAILQNIGHGEICQAVYSAPDCNRGECPWLAHSADWPDGGTDPGNPPIWDDFGCIATLGTGGCGFEQQLEASFQALTVQAEPGRPNEGFLREDSLLAIVYVTDEDDCSAANGELFNTGRDDFGSPNTRCAFNPGELHPIERYVDAFLALREDNPDSVVVAAIVGIPPRGDTRWQPGDTLERLREMVQVNPSNPQELQPSCTTGGQARIAYPPVRIVDLIYRFGNNGILGSICDDDWTPVLQAITRKIQEKLPGACMPRQLASTDPGVCRVIETLIGEGECPHLADVADEGRTRGWHQDLGVNEDGRRECEVLPADYDGDGCPDNISREDCEAERYGPGSAALQGWFVINSSGACSGGAEVRFTHTDVTSDMSRIRFECRTALCPLRRQCGAAAAAAPECDPWEPGTCDGRCIRHNSAEICGTDAEGNPQSCARCTPTLGDTCPQVRSQCQAEPDRRYRFGCDVPLIQEGGCCAEGFHCEDLNGQPACVPDRTTRCTG